MRFVAIAMLGAVAGACIARDRFVCSDMSECTLVAGGVCHEGACAYPDDDCPSMLRYGDLAGERAGRCVEDDGVAEDSSTTDATAETSGASVTAATTESTDDGESTGDDTGGIPSVCDGVTCSGAGTCVVVDDAPTCACESGYWAIELECLLDPCDDVVCHYLDDVAGDDANDGSIDAPWRTLQRLSMALPDALPGDHFLLRRGGVWGDETGGFRIYVSNVVGSPDAPVVIGAYGPLADGRPAILPGNVRVSSSSHVVLRDLHIQDDPDDPVISDLYGNRPCILVQYSDHVTIVDNELEQCEARGVWVSYGSSYMSIVANTVRDTGNEAIAITDTFDEPPVRVGPHHWVLDNVIERAATDGIWIDIQSAEVHVGDAKVVGNRIADTGTNGVHCGTTGFAWVVDNVVARAGAPNVWQASFVLGAREGGQLSGNTAFETGGHGMLANHIARIESNTVIHDGVVGEAFALDDLSQVSAQRNLVWARGGRDSLRLLYDTAAEHIVALDDQWYVGEDETTCVFRDADGSYDLAAWQDATGLDVASACASVPGVGGFDLGVAPAEWDEAFMDALTPDASWSRCADPVGARDCEGAAIGPAVEPLTGFDEANGLGWFGPLVVRQRYDIAP